MTPATGTLRPAGSRTVVPAVDLSGRHPLLALTPDGVGRLHRAQREQRVELLITESRTFLQRGLDDLVARDGKDLAGLGVLFSGGNDSTILGHLFRRDVTTAVHLNTGIGIEATRTFVRDTCRAWVCP